MKLTIKKTTEGNLILLDGYYTFPVGTSCSVDVTPKSTEIAFNITTDNVEIEPVEEDEQETQSYQHL